MIGPWSPALAQPAAAAADSITVNWASSPATQSGLLQVSLTASSAITSLSAQLYAAGATSPSATITSFTPPGTGPQSSGVWAASSPIAWGDGAGELPLGVYSVEITASDQGGTTVTNVAAGSLRLLIEPSLTFAVSPSSISYGNRTATFFGSVTGTYPDGTTGAIDGATVTMSPEYGGGSGFTATTGPDGSYTITGQATDGYWQAMVTAGPAGLDTAADTFQQAGLTVTPDQVKLTAELASGSVNYGQADAASGLVTYQNGATWQPLTGFPVTIDRGALVCG
jgi:hypothetical protein